MSATVTLDFGQKQKVEAPLWTKGMQYKDRVAEIGEHFTWYYDYRGFSVKVHVPVSLFPSWDERDRDQDFWFDAKYSAQDRFIEIFGGYGPERNDVYSSPSESARDNFPPGLGTILHYKVNEITTKEVAE